ncbi:secreted acidic protein 1A-like [Rhodamnia argentea]|uniref:Secreted acidic protein 1A-like n=1 Tax=Rhodamnia argentea TaxID=178133 RepID=A0A8B8QMQ4_9MYRT|nr:secreted acidic protein 1A-like [Rhodamnia argentea]
MELSRAQRCSGGAIEEESEREDGAFNVGGSHEGVRLQDDDLDLLEPRPEKCVDEEGDGDVLDPLEPGLEKCADDDGDGDDLDSLEPGLEKYVDDDGDDGAGDGDDLDLLEPELEKYVDDDGDSNGDGD